jgi:hypothetical protein
VCTGAATIEFTSRILEGVMAGRGLVEPRRGIGCWVSGGWGVGQTDRLRRTVASWVVIDPVWIHVLIFSLAT